MKQQGFDDQHEKEGLELIAIGCLYGVVFILAVLVAVYCIKKDSVVTVVSAMLAFAVWRLIKVMYGDKWKVDAVIKS
jgi:hypothetical protein